MNTSILALAFILILGGCGGSSSDSGDSSDVLCKKKSRLGCFERDESSVNIVTGYKDSDDAGCCPKDVVIPAGITEIADSAFSSRELTSVIIADSVETVGDNVFADNPNLTSVTLSFSDGITEIGANRFSGFSLTSVTIPSGVTSIGDSAFSDNQLTFAIIPDTVTSLVTNPFERNPDLTSVTLSFSDGITEIASGRFSSFSAPLTSITIPDGVTAIRIYAFDGNNHLTSVIIPSSVTTIEGYAFSDNSRLASVCIAAQESDISVGSNAFPSTVTPTYGCSPSL